MQILAGGQMSKFLMQWISPCLINKNLAKFINESLNDKVTRLYFTLLVFILNFFFLDFYLYLCCKVAKDKFGKLA